MSALVHVSRFFGFGSGLSKHTLGDGSALVGLGDIAPEFRGKLNEIYNVPFSTVTPEAVIDAEEKANRLEASAYVYKALLRAKQKEGGAFVTACEAQMNHGVAIAKLNSRLVKTQGRVIAEHSKIGFDNARVGAATAGAVKGYTNERSAVFQF